MVREATINDIDSINELGTSLNKNFTKVFDMSKILEEKISKVYVYEDDKVIGFIHITDLKETVDIINVIVDKSHRNKGIATILMDYMISNCDPEINYITLEVSTLNKAAINLYKKFGFEIVNTRKNYYEDSDAYLMGRKMNE